MQMEAVECGAACLAMILAYHGNGCPGTAAEECGVSRMAAKPGTWLLWLEPMGLRPRDTAKNPLCARMVLPAIIHWNFNHFVVLCGFKKGRATNDPARGRIEVSLEELDQSFTDRPGF